MAGKEQNKVIDLTFLREFCKNDKDKMANYIHMFLESAPEQMEAMKEEANAGNWPAVKSTAHSLKPQLAFIGVGFLQPLVEKIEAAAVSERAPLETPTLLFKFEVLLDQSFNQLIQTLVSLA